MLLAKKTRGNLITDYLWAFYLGCDKDRYADIEPVPVYVNLGVTLVNKIFCQKMPPRMEAKGDMLVEKLQEEGTIQCWKCPPYGAVLRSVSRKGNRDPRLVINFRGLNAEGFQVGYPFSFLAMIHHPVLVKS